MKPIGLINKALINEFKKGEAQLIAPSLLFNGATCHGMSNLGSVWEMSWCLSPKLLSSY